MTSPYCLSIGVAVITHKAKHHLKRCLPHFLNSPLKPKVLVVNSSSFDGTVELAKSMGAQTLIIPRSAFNHGSTREKARKVLGTDIVVMVTPDAYPTSCDLLEKLVFPLIHKQASVAYARQLPHDGAGFFEKFARDFNYPEQGHIRSLKDVDHFGSYTFFCSDSCAAYLQSALDSVGGFPSVLLGEDTVVVAKLLKQGHHIAYVAQAKVQHSHSYSLIQEFKRHFDTGLARYSYQSLLKVAGSDSKRGKTYVKTLFKTLFFQKPYLIPYAICQVFVKWLGYRLGKGSYFFPLWWKKRLSSQDFFWISDDFTKRGLFE